MKLLKSIVVFNIFYVFFIPFALAQNEQDMLRYSRFFPYSTARSLSLGGAMGALGHDIGSYSINPAGIAVNRYNLFSCSGGTLQTISSANYVGDIAKANRFNLNFPSMGIVLTGIKYDNNGKPISDGLANVNLLFAYNRVTPLYEEYSFSGRNSKSSIADLFAQQANGYSTDELDENYADPFALAYKSGVIKSSGTFGQYVPSFIENNNTPRPAFLQSGQNILRGNVNEFTAGLAASYSHRWFIGGTFIIHTIRFHSTLNYQENDIDNTAAYIQNMEYNQKLFTSGSGAGFKLGAIYRADNLFRIGLSYHSPMVYSLTDQYSYSVSSIFDKPINGSSNYINGSDEQNFSYRAYRPGRLVLSLALVKEKKGLWSLDAEFVNYSNGNLTSTLYDFNQENKNIINMYNPVWNIRTGGELFFENTFLRCGYAYMASPYADKSTYAAASSSRHLLSGGLGITNKYSSIDMAIGYMVGKDYFTPYSISSLPYESAIVRKQSYTMMLTYNYKF
ncbi:MAG: outer membrane protein transport protein [Bacteroidota bacterium]|nr:outer membrane protein transport protein [Bacteroidota bacterium]